MPVLARFYGLVIKMGLPLKSHYEFYKIADVGVLSPYYGGSAFENTQ
jgi:hypothetical protein